MKFTDMANRFEFRKTSVFSRFLAVAATGAVFSIVGAKFASQRLLSLPLDTSSEPFAMVGRLGSAISVESQAYIKRAMDVVSSPFGIAVVAAAFALGWWVVRRIAAMRGRKSRSEEILNLASSVKVVEREFLPAALEIVETPPSPIGRAIGATIIAFFCAALVWASIGEINIVASASGKIVPTARTKIIQPFETGVVRTIHVHDGQRVKSGDPLIDLDPTINTAEAEHLKSDLIAAKLEVSRLEAALEVGGDPIASFRPPEEASASLVEMQKSYLLSQVSEEREKQKALDRQKAAKTAEVATIIATINKLEATIPIARKRVEVHEALKQFGTRLTYLDALQALTDQEEELKVDKARLQEAEAAVAVVAGTQAEAAEEYRRTRYQELAEAKRKVAGTSQDLIRAVQRTNLQQLTAPIDGIVQQLAIHTVGGVVTPAQPLLALVPDDSHLEIEAIVTNRDIGFIHVGQDAEIKVDTFNFTRYGLLHGKVQSVSLDAITRPNSSGAQKGADIDNEHSDKDLVYSARISLAQTDMQIDDNRVSLVPGMAVTAEINTGSRRLMSYLLSPLVRYRHDSLRER